MDLDPAPSSLDGMFHNAATEATTSVITSQGNLSSSRPVAYLLLAS